MTDATMASEPRDYCAPQRPSILHRGCIIFRDGALKQGRDLREWNKKPNLAHAGWCSRIWRACLFRAKAKGVDISEFKRQPRTIAEWPEVVLAEWSATVRKVGPEPDLFIYPGGEMDGMVWLPRYTPTAPSGRLPPAPYDITLSLNGLNLRSYQRDAVNAWLSSGRVGVLQIPTGGGKTPVGIACLAATPTPAVILVPTIELFLQWRKWLEKWVPDALVGYAGSGEMANWDEARVCVAIMATVVGWTQPERKARLSRFGLLIEDECHHIPAETYAAIVASCQGPYRLGLSATPYRKDGLTDWIFWSMGPVVYKISQQLLEDLGHILQPVVRTPSTGWTLPKELEGARWDEIFSGEKIIRQWRDGTSDRQLISEHGLIRDAERNALLRDLILAEVQEGRRVFAITSRVEHTEIIAALVNDASEVAVMVTGKTAKGKRKKIMARVVAGEIGVLIGTVGKEGFDAPALDTILLMTPINPKAKSDLFQYIGRGLRPAPGKEARLIDPIDDWEPFVNWGRARRAIYRNMGWLPKAGRRS
jgi:superfamily II DNA or RNA helicase